MRERLRFGSLLCATFAVAMAALIDAAAFGSAALAQGGTTQSIAADLVFAAPDSLDFKQGGADRLLDAAALLDAITQLLNGLGPSVRVTAKSAGGTVSAVIINAQTAQDKEPPKLDTNSVPPKGTTVKAGDTIKATMIARDHANLWQSGIKTIQIVAESEGGRFIASENFERAPPGCTALPSERRVEATYVVPSNPPPIVRLATLAEDHAGLMETDLGEFPTKGIGMGHSSSAPKV